MVFRVNREQIDVSFKNESFRMGGRMEGKAWNWRMRLLARAEERIGDCSAFVE